MTIRLKFRDKPLRPVRDCQHDPQGNPADDGVSAIAAFGPGHKATPRGNATVVHDSDGKHVATLHAIHRFGNDTDGNLLFYPKPRHSTTDNHQGVLHQLNEHHSLFYRRMS